MDKDVRLWGMLSHLSALSGFVGIPFGNIIGPLVILLVKGKEDAFIESQAKEALNFQISMIIYGIVAGVLCIVLIGFLLLVGLFMADIVLTVIAAVKANQGESYRYPVTIRFIS